MARPMQYKYNPPDEQAKDQVREVNALMAGQPAADVHAELVRRLGTIRFRANAETVRRFAAAIEGGYLVEEGHPKRLNSVILRFDAPPAPKRMGEA